jgi:periplasmic protein TonB
MIILLTSVALYLSTIQSPPASFHVDPSLGDTCKRGQDSITKRTIYLDADIGPECEGGSAALLRRFNKSIKFPKTGLTGPVESQYIVGFIVEANGEITGERVIRDNTNQIGQQILKMVKSCQWYPARCNGKKVAFLYKLPVIIDIQEE